MSTITKVVIGLFVLGVIGVAASRDKGQTFSRSAPTTSSTSVSEGTSTGVAASSRRATADSANVLTFGKPTIKTEYGMTTVMVEATNPSDFARSCMLTATFKDGDTILGTANGAINKVPPHGTRTAELLSTDNVERYKTMKLEASTCF